MFGDIPINKLRPTYLADQIEAMYAASPSCSKDLHGYTDEVVEYALGKEYILANHLPKKKSLTIPKPKSKSHGSADLCAPRVLCVTHMHLLRDNAFFSAASSSHLCSLSFEYRRLFDRVLSVFRARHTTR